MSSEHEIKDDTQVLNKPDKILLMGNPNVGKSIFFSELTGVKAISSNYAGTTVSFMEGQVALGEKKYTLIDVPGTYSLTPSTEAEAVATRFVESGALAIICVFDASNLERNLCLALQLKKYNIPVVYALNLIDVAARQGIIVNDKLLAQELGATVIPTVAVKREGVESLKAELQFLLEKKSIKKDKPCNNCSSCPSSNRCNQTTWNTAKEIARRVIKREKIAPGFADKLGDNMMKPWPGIPLAFLAIAVLIAFVAGGGELLREFVLLPLVEHAIVPFFTWVFSSFIPEGVFLNILVGEYGIFVISFEWILALILPYVFLFYVAFSFLEDSGYLPRLSILFDNIMRKIGVQGGSLLHVMMGFGCAVPAIIGTRNATSKKERLIIAAAICFAIPCISQTAALVSLFSSSAWWLLPAIIGFWILLFVGVVFISSKIIKGKVDPLLIEVPNLLLPSPRPYFRKLAIRMKHFLKDAEVPLLIAIVIVAIVTETGLLNWIAGFAEPFMSGWLGLPPEAALALILGVIRREMAVVPLLVLGLNPLQVFVAGVVALMYLPCISVFGILVKEFKLKTALILTLSTIALALLAGGLINQVGQLFI
jgi:ferrous iron transport protein B